MSQKPAHVIRLGRIKATIWRNVTQKGTRCNVQIVRLYREGEQWKQTQSFGRDDLPLVCKVADLAHGWIYLASTPKPPATTPEAEAGYREQEARLQQFAGG